MYASSNISMTPSNPIPIQRNSSNRSHPRVTQEQAQRALEETEIICQISQHRLKHRRRQTAEQFYNQEYHRSGGQKPSQAFVETHIYPLLAKPDPNRGCLKHIPLPADYGDIVKASRNKVKCPHGRWECADCVFPMDFLEGEGVEWDERMSFAQVRQLRKDIDFLVEIESGVRRLAESIYVRPIPSRTLVKEKEEGWEKRVNEVRRLFASNTGDLWSRTVAFDQARTLLDKKDLPPYFRLQVLMTLLPLQTTSMEGRALLTQVDELIMHCKVEYPHAELADLAKIERAAATGWSCLEWLVGNE